MKTILKFVCRLVPSVTFIFSGFVKAIDPVGGAIKFQDYFTAFHLDLLIPIALPLAIALAAIEFLIGIYLLLKIYMRLVVPLAVLIMSIFTLLTLYIAIFNPVSDCGCFGDAITLSNWQTFWKNVIVILFAAGMFYLRKEYLPVFSQNRTLVIGIAMAIYITTLSVYSYNNLPIIDFRPFKIGNNIHDLMNIPEGAEMPEFETFFILEKDGEQQTFALDDYPFDDTTWVYIDSETRILKEGYIPPLQTFALLDAESGDVTQEIVTSQGPLFLIISPRIQKTTKEAIKPIAELAESARLKNIQFYVVTASNKDETLQFDMQHNTMFNYLQTDETTLKTIIRSNPGMVLLQDGTIVGKWHHRNLPGVEIMNNPLAMSISEQTSNRTKRLIWIHILGLVLIPLTFYSIKTTK